MAARAITLFVNGQKQVLSNLSGDTTLLDYLRSSNVQLTGTKLGCGEGGCGACSVSASKWDANDQQVKHFAVNACLVPVLSLDGHAITTVEGLGTTKQIHAVQEKIAAAHGSQCGYCTPGIVMALNSYLHSHPNATQQEVEDSFDGNLCRCTGYRPIIEAARELNASVIAEQPGKELPFPEELKSFTPEELEVDADGVKWFRPLSLGRMVAIKAQHPEAKVSVGSTELTIEVKFKTIRYPTYISPMAVPELNGISLTESGISVGAAVPLNTLNKYLTSLSSELPEYQTRGYRAIIDQLRWFAGNQVRNMACLGGNIATASPISDVVPLLIATGSTITVQSTAGERVVAINKDFFKGYRQIALSPDEVIVNVHIPFTREHEYVRAFKQARRRDDDIAIVSAGMRVLLAPAASPSEYPTVKEASLGFGGMAPYTVHAASTSAALVGKEWNDACLYEALRNLETELPLPLDAPGGMINFRSTLSTSFFFKFHQFVLREMGGNVDKRLHSVLDPYPHRPESTGKQEFFTKESNYPVGEPVTHLSAYKQVTGEATYTDDLVLPPGSLHAYFVYSSRAHAKIVSIDASEALAIEGVVDFISAKDIPGKNQVGPVFKDDELFATEEVQFVGDAIGLVVASDPKIAERASVLVKVVYEDLPAILTIPEAIEKQSFHLPDPLSIERGDIATAFDTCDHIVEGEMEVGGQEHFYLETHVSHVYPGEEDEMTIVASTQDPSATQGMVSQVLGIDSNRVVAKAKRLGGGFGGKESRSCYISCAAAVAAKKLRRPVRLALDRDDDMLMTGGRHAFLGKYKVGFNKDGKLQALDLKLYNQAGYSFDLSKAVMERALLHAENNYFIPNVRVQGWLCKTNTATNTAYRGFGGPQSMMICETWMDQVAHASGLEKNEVRRMNMYEEGQDTYYGQVLAKHDVTASRCWDELMTKSRYTEREELVRQFNAENRYKKRGIYMLPTKFGMSFTVKFLNQASALVHIYTDGTVLVSHGGTEMGQGLHTKMAQVAARALGCPLNDVHIAETATDKIPNASPTAASVSSDLNGGAVLDACEQLNERLRELREANPGKELRELAHIAWMNQIDLSAHGYFSRPNIGYDFVKNVGTPFAYHVTGAVCSEVEVDCLTGDFQVLKTDIVMDVGDSLSPAIDIGQIEGAFVQGMGWSTIEQVVYNEKTGAIVTRGPGNYKIPGFKDVPLEMNVHLLNDAPNPTVIHSSKGIGEPPFFLGAGVMFAIRQAIKDARAEVGAEDWFYLSSPATCEQIRMAAVDPLSIQFENNLGSPLSSDPEEL
eukprot:TRINITY_DN7138_c0_g1_i1.p1 TRINITY_DN7138_c0_g1~~TRINITY_DN7138_c0_g1_i1.p1  ORF type:complete len:1292 (-),score=300.19 TRINITY_DN7138_c0_g1_i1:42-3917(-)